MHSCMTILCSNFDEQLSTFDICNERNCVLYRHATGLVPVSDKRGGPEIHVDSITGHMTRKSQRTCVASEAS